MRRLLSILAAACLLCCPLSGCSSVPSDDDRAGAGMRLSPVSLTEEETELLWLAGVDVPSSASFTLYDYQTDGNLHAIFFSRYLLNDALEWEKDDFFSPGAFDETPLDAAGRLSLTLGEDGAYTFYVRAEGGLGYSHPAPQLPEGLPGSAAVGASSQTEPLTITYGQEIPLLIRTIRGDDSLALFALGETLENDPEQLERFRSAAFTEAYTVTFFDQIPQI